MASESPFPALLQLLHNNKYMGGVDLGDQLRGYYQHRIKSRKYILTSWSECHLPMPSSIILIELSLIQHDHQEVPGGSSNTIDWRALQQA